MYLEESKSIFHNFSKTYKELVPNPIYEKFNRLNINENADKTFAGHETPHFQSPLACLDRSHP